jgi:hypothetical protein
VAAVATTTTIIGYNGHSYVIAFKYSIMKPSKMRSAHLVGKVPLSTIEEFRVASSPIAPKEIYDQYKIHHTTLAAATSKTLRMISKVSFNRIFCAQATLILSGTFQKSAIKLVATLLDAAVRFICKEIQQTLRIHQKQVQQTFNIQQQQMKQRLKEQIQLPEHQVDISEVFQEQQRHLLALDSAMARQVHLFHWVFANMSRNF